MATPKDVLTTKGGSLWIFPDGPNHAGQYLGCTNVDDITAPQGDLTLMRCFAPDGGWKTVGKKRGAPGAVTTTLTQLTFQTRSWLERIRSRYGMVLLERDAGRVNNFKGWARALILADVRNTATKFSGVLKRDADDDSTVAFPVTARPPVIEAVPISGARLSIVSPYAVNDIAMLKIGTGIKPVKYGVCVTDGDVAAKGRVYITSDGGKTWTNTAAQPFANNQAISACAIVDMGNNIHRLIVSREGTGAAYQGQMAYSDDSGATWVVVSIGGPTAGHGAQNGGTLFAHDPHHVWLASCSGYIYFSSDAGQTWTAQDAGVVTIIHYHGLDFLPDLQTGYAVAQSGVVVKTVNGGTDWIACNSAISGTPILKCVNVRDADNVWVGTETGKLYYTEDGGDNWLQRSGWIGSGSGYISNLGFANDYVGFMLTSNPTGFLYRTVDGGYTWERLQMDASNALFSMFVGDENYVNIVGAVLSANGWIGLAEE